MATPHHVHAHGRRGLAPASVLAVGAVAAALGLSVSGQVWEVLSPETTPVERLASRDPAERSAAAAHLVANRTSDWPDDHRRAFLDTVAPLAVSSGAEHCLPPSVTIAQAVLESGWGTSQKARKHHNLFGMKAQGTSGVASETWEVVDGVAVPSVERFRTYPSWAESLADHDVRIATNALYAAARAQRHDPRAFVAALAPVYATDPAYGRRLHELIDTYDLDAFDAAAREAAARRGRCTD